MTIQIKAEYHDGVASTAFYPYHVPILVATGGAGGLAGGGWSVDTWAHVVAIFVAKSGGTWESQAPYPLSGFIPASVIFTESGHAVPYQGRVSWTNTSTSYRSDVEIDRKISGVWTSDHTFTDTTNGGTQEGSAWTSVAGGVYRARVRYYDGTTFGDWSSYTTHTFPS
jgi:hypothetical protein